MAKFRYDSLEPSIGAYNFVDKSSFLIAVGRGPARWLRVS